MTRYQSSYCDKKVTAAQYLAELVCEHQARKRNINLPYRFWQDKIWAKEFKKQINLAAALLRIYDEKALVKAVAKTPYLYSLYGKFVDKLIVDLEKEDAKFKDVKVIEKPSISVPSTPKPNNLKSKL